MYDSKINLQLENQFTAGSVLEEPKKMFGELIAT
jgi:hypothetical protein